MKIQEQSRVPQKSVLSTLSTANLFSLLIAVKNGMMMHCILKSCDYIFKRKTAWGQSESEK